MAQIVHLELLLYDGRRREMLTERTNVRDVFLSAFSSSDPWAHRGSFAFVSELGVPRMALAGSRPDFFVPRYKDMVLDTERLAFDDESVRRQEIGLGFAGVCGDKDSKLKAVYKAI
ncbi:hypothetical protein Tco_1253161, partial [Tanacetum coccineum]